MCLGKYTRTPVCLVLVRRRERRCTQPWEGLWLRQVRTWSRQYKASQTEEIESMDKVMDWLPMNIPLQSRASVVHGDFRVDNLIYDESDPNTVLAVLDWELSTLGDPLADATYSCLAHFVPHDNTILPGLQGRDLEHLGIPTYLEYLEQYLEYLEQYCRETGIQSMAQPWNFYLSFCFFRIAAILQGVYKRSLEGKASGHNAKEAGRMAKEFADISWNFALKQESVNKVA